MNDSVTDPATRHPTVLVDDRAACGCDVEDLGGLLASVLSAEGVPEAAEAGLHLVDVDEMEQLNLEAMGETGPTDVLSFPVDGRPDTPNDQESPEPVVPRLVGDVVVCPEVASTNAPTHAGNLGDECRLLVVHGGLHLCGWDHSTPGDQGAMWSRERELMHQLGVTPGRDPWTDS